MRVKDKSARLSLTGSVRSHTMEPVLILRLENSVKIRIAASLAACAGIFLLVSGCMTQRGSLSVAEADKPIKIIKTEDLILTVRYLDDDTLKQKFGKETNPFLSDYYSLQFRRFMVFELSIENTGSVPVKFLLNRLELQYGGKAMFAYNKFRINQYWEFKDDQDEVKGIHKARRERFVKDNVLPDSVTIPAPGELKRYAVFTGNTPNYGTATLYVPVFTPMDEVVHRFEVPFEF